MWQAVWYDVYEEVDVVGTLGCEVKSATLGVDIGLFAQFGTYVGDETLLRGKVHSLTIGTARFADGDDVVSPPLFEAAIYRYIENNHTHITRFTSL